MHIIWKQPDETLAITSILNGEDPVEHAKSLKERGAIPASWEAVAFNLPVFPDWERQEDWRFVNGEFVVSLDAARLTTQERLRNDRAVKFADLDASFMKALERGEDTTQIVAEKDRLRDITLRVFDCNSIEELKALSV